MESPLPAGSSTITNNGNNDDTSNGTTNSAEDLRQLTERFCLPLSTIADAKDTFDVYCTIASSPVENGAVSGPQLLSAQGLQAFLRDMGAPKTTSEVQELIHTMVAIPTDAVRLRQKEWEAYTEAKVAYEQREALADPSLEVSQVSEQAHTSPPPPPVAPPTACAAPSSAAAAASCLPDGSEGLSFPLFLFLLHQSDLGGGGAGEQREGASAMPAAARTRQSEEACEVFRTLDRDGDGALTEADVRAALARLLLLQEENVTLKGKQGGLGGASALATNSDLLKLAALHPAELRAALDECDVNADGIVTEEDYVALMHS